MYVIIGKSGQLAQELFFTKPKQKVTLLGRNEIDLFDSDSISHSLNKLQPKTIINASGYTFVDDAEINVDAAFKLNFVAVQNLVNYCELTKTSFVHISSDFVFDGKKSTPYEINDSTHPLSVYGQSKLAGEQVILENITSFFTIIRTSWLYSSFGNNFVKNMLNLMSSNKSIKVVSDQIGSPTYCRSLANFIWNLVDTDHFDPIYHWCDLGNASWYDFACEIYSKATKLGKITNKLEILPIRSQDFSSLAKRPAYSVLKPHQNSNTKWQDNLEAMLREL